MTTQVNTYTDIRLKDFLEENNIQLTEAIFVDLIKSNPFMEDHLIQDEKERYWIHNEWNFIILCKQTMIIR